MRKLATCFLIPPVLEDFCAVILLGGFGNTERLSQNRENSPEDENRGFCIKSVRIQNLNCENCEDTFGWLDPRAMVFVQDMCEFKYSYFSLVTHLAFNKVFYNCKAYTAKMFISESANR